MNPTTLIVVVVAGRKYRTRNGRTHGPMALRRPNAPGCSYPFVYGGYVYTASGRVYDGEDHDFDLVEEITEPKYVPWTPKTFPGNLCVWVRPKGGPTRHLVTDFSDTRAFVDGTWYDFESLFRSFEHIKCGNNFPFEVVPCGTKE